MSAITRPFTEVMTAVQPNRAVRLQSALERDGETCVWCSRPFDPLVRPTTEHLVPRVKGGPSWPENELAACSRCNRQRGHTTRAEWVEECRRRGWEPDLPRVLTALQTLQSAVTERGGQRRARPYIQSQLRRLKRL
jgi:hypothetical protein